MFVNTMLVCLLCIEIQYLKPVSMINIIPFKSGECIKIALKLNRILSPFQSANKADSKFKMNNMSRDFFIVPQAVNETVYTMLRETVERINKHTMP
jgi:hypothetical protein